MCVFYKKKKKKLTDEAMTTGRNRGQDRVDGTEGQQELDQFDVALLDGIVHGSVPFNEN